MNLRNKSHSIVTLMIAVYVAIPAAEAFPLVYSSHHHEPVQFVTRSFTQHGLGSYSASSVVQGRSRNFNSHQHRIPAASTLNIEHRTIGPLINQNYNSHTGSFAYQPTTPWKKQNFEAVLLPAQSVDHYNQYSNSLTPQNDGIHITPDYSNGLEYPDPYLLTGNRAKAAVNYLFSKELFYDDYPHAESLLRHQELRKENGLEGNHLSSARPDSPFYRY